MSKLKKPLLTVAILIAAVTASLLMFGFGAPALADAHVHSTMTALSVRPANGELSTGAYYLTANISGNLIVTGNVTLCLNGHNVQGDGTDAVITVSEGATFTLCDCQQQSGCITGGTGYDEGEVGGGVYVAANATFTMDGGTISGNSANVGGGVFVSGSATFSMDGGTISGNSADTGGGVEVYGTFEVSNNPNIMGNTNTNGDNDNVRITQPIIVTGALTSGAQIGVYNTGVATSGYGDNNKDLDGNIIAPDNYFVADNARYAPVLQDGEVGVVLANQVAAVTVDGNETVYDDILDAWDAANDATTSQDSPAVVKLLTNVTTEYNLSVANGSFITLDLNGYILNYIDDLKFSVITVDGAFTLQDSRPQAEHNYDVTDDGLWVFNDYGEHTLYGGVITGGKQSCVNINNGTFTMNGGSVSGNYSSRDNSAGGVYVGDGCAFTLTGGSISGNTGAHGVYVIGAFTMTDGKISNNTSLSSAVMVKGNGAMFTMTGGAISDNTSTHDAAGLIITSGCMFTMSGTAVISGNTGVYWGGVYMSGGTITMEGGEISGNTATHDLGQGGGVFASGTFTMTGGKISGNQAANGGGVYFSGGTITMEGGEISGNTATHDLGQGGGVFVRLGALEVSGAVNITGNKATDGSDSNVYLPEDLHITVADALTDGAQIGVSHGGGVVAMGFTQDDKPSKYFIPDNPAHNCIYLSDASLGAVTVDEHDYQAEFTVDTEPTCTTAGSKSKHCAHCDSITDVTEIPVLGHTLTRNPAKPATEDEDGNIEYWSCDVCDEFFLDEDGATEITDKTGVIIPKLENISALWITLIAVLSAVIVAEIAVIVYRSKRKFKAKERK